MTVVDFGAARRRYGRVRGHRDGRRRTAGQGAPQQSARQAAAHETRRILGSGVVSTTEGPNKGSAVASGAVIPHPLDQQDVVAFLVVADSDAHIMLQSARSAEFSFEEDTGWGPVAGPVELVRADQIQAEWFRRLVGEVFTAAGGSAADLAVHETTIGLAATVVALLRPEPMSRPRAFGTVTADGSRYMGRQTPHLVVLQGGRSA